MFPTRRAYELKPISLLTALIELAVIFVFVFNFTTNMRDPAENLRVRGNEYSYLVSSGAVASAIFQRVGALPLWNPFIGTGEPLIENPFSFVLNPLLSWPILLQGPVQGGKTATMLHILLMAAGGWALARILRLGSLPRVMLGLLLGGSGSMAGAIGLGFYQVGLSQAYIPWVITGLIGTLYLPRRWPVGLLVVSSILLLFAGTFWYALPVVIMAAVITFFAVFWWSPDQQRLQIDGWMIRRLVLASVLTIGIAAIRLIPQAAHGTLIDHPLETLTHTYDFATLMPFYFSTVIASYDTQLGLTDMYFHYILPPLFVFLLLLVYLGFSARRTTSRIGEWRILVPALIFILIFTAWAQEGTLGIKWLYQNFPLLGEWRFVGRIMAAASPWIAVIAVIGLDVVITFLWKIITEARNRPATAEPEPVVFAAQLSLVVVVIACLFSAMDVLANWTRVAGTDSTNTPEQMDIRYLRQQHPAEFLSVRTDSFFVYLPFYSTLTRAVYGNPDYRPKPLPSTIGSNDIMQFWPEYAAGQNSDFVNLLTQNGFQLVSGSNVRPRIEPGKSYIFSVWMKTNGMGQAGSKVQLLQLNPSGGPVGGTTNNVWQSQSISGTTDWQKINYTFTAAPDAASLDVNLLMQGNGTVWFDDVYLGLDNSGATLAPGTQSSPSTNLFPDGDFELNPVNANGWTTQGNAVFGWASETAHSGTYSAKITGDTSWASFNDVAINTNTLSTLSLWANHNVPTYAFMIPVDDLAYHNSTPLTRKETEPVSNFAHNIDNIHLTVGNHKPDSVLVIQETAYPGWTVTINGQPATVESVGGRVGVRLPNQTANVIFAYRPTILYMSAVITLLAILIFIGYLLQLDRFLPASVAARADTAWQSIQRRLLSESGVESSPDANISMTGHENGKTPHSVEVSPPEPVSTESED